MSKDSTGWSEHIFSEIVPCFDLGSDAKKLMKEVARSPNVHTLSFYYIEGHGVEYGPKEWKYVRNAVNANPAIKRLIFNIRTLDDKISKSIAKIFSSTSTIQEVLICIQHFQTGTSFDILCSGLQKNNSIKTIGLWDDREQYMLNGPLKNAEIIKLLDAVKKIKNVKKIRATYFDLTLLCNNLKNNINITDLQLTNFSLKELIPPVTDLFQNSSHVKRFIIGSPSADTAEDAQQFMDMLVAYNSLTRLKFKRCNFTDEDLSILGNNLNGIKNLQELNIEQDGLASITPVLEQLKHNNSITYLKIKVKAEVERIQNKLKEVLKYNKALNSVVITKNEKKTPMIEEELLKNKLDQDRTRSAGLNLIKMIALRRNLMTLVFPLEIWIMILTYMNCPGEPIDFGSALQRTIARLSSKSL